VSLRLDEVIALDRRLACDHRLGVVAYLSTV
jgi:hypothetical protein